MEALIDETNDGEDLIDLVTRIKKVNAELTLTKNILNKKVEVLGQNMMPNMK